MSMAKTKPRTTPIQKVLIILAAGCFVALASLTASLPINLPSQQYHHGTTEPGTENLNNGDTAFIICCTIFGFILAPVLALLYANLYGKEQQPMINTVMISTTMISVVWIVISFSLTYGDDANADRILGFPVTHYMFRDVGPAPQEAFAPTIPFSIFAFYELTFACLTPALLIIDLIDRVNVLGFLFFIMVWHLVVYCPIAFITWHPRGFLNVNSVQDFCGAVPVHILASVTLIVANYFLTWRGAPNPRSRIPNNAQHALLYIFLVWFLWLGVTAGKQHAASPPAAQVVVNTFCTVSTSLAFGFLSDSYLGIQFTNIAVVNSVLIGLISVSACAGFTTVGGAMCIAIATYTVVKVVSRYFLKESLDPEEPLSILSLHGIGGTGSFILSSISSYEFINPDAYNGGTYGNAVPFAHTVAAAMVLWCSIAISVGVVLVICNFVFPISKDAPEDLVFRPTFEHETHAFVSNTKRKSKKSDIVDPSVFKHSMLHPQQKKYAILDNLKEIVVYKGT